MSSERWRKEGTSRSAGHRRETARAGGPGGYDYNVYFARCPTRVVLDRIADKWAMLILGRLEDGPVRFNQLRREIEGVSQKVLSQSLKRLERDGLVLRTVFPTVPVTVEYALTPLGRTLTDTFASVRRWAETHIESVLAAQAAYDSGGKPPAAVAAGERRRPRARRA